MVPEVSAKIMQELDYFTLFDFKLSEELYKAHWLEHANFEVKFNDKRIFSVAMWIEGSAAQPDGVTKYLNFNSISGRRVASIDLFTNRGKLTRALNAKLQTSKEMAIDEIRKSPEIHKIDENQLFSGNGFNLYSMDKFYVSEEGVTFVYEYKFPPDIKALEPESEYTVGWKELEPFIRRDGLLAAFIT